MAVELLGTQQDKSRKKNLNIMLERKISVEQLQHVISSMYSTICYLLLGLKLSIKSNMRWMRGFQWLSTRISRACSTYGHVSRARTSQHLRSHRARLPNEVFSRILRQLEVVTLNYGTMDSHLNEVTRSRYISTVCFAIRKLENLQLLN